LEDDTFDDDNPAAITQADIILLQAMHAGFEYYGAFPQDVIQNQNYSKTNPA
jgi:hypothetical protein